MEQLRLLRTVVRQYHVPGGREVEVVPFLQASDNPLLCSAVRTRAVGPRSERGGWRHGADDPMGMRARADGEVRIRLALCSKRLCRQLTGVELSRMYSIT